jgi:hypothetical protein
MKNELKSMEVWYELQYTADNEHWLTWVRDDLKTYKFTLIEAENQLINQLDLMTKQKVLLGSFADEIDLPKWRICKVEILSY